MLPVVPNGSATSADRPAVLIVDDVDGNTTLLEAILRVDGYQFSHARNGQEAMEAIRRFPPDVVLMDVVMPTMDGIETCRHIKADRRTRLIPVVLLTALQDVESRARGLAVGADDFISKPVNAGELRALVRSLLRIKHYTADLDSAESVILSLALTIEARDRYTDGHCQRLAAYAAALGREISLAEEDIRALVHGGFLHDIGKVGIPDSILLKPTRLTPSEYDVMKQHVVIGDRLCGELQSLRRVRPIVRHHHERLDGSGYPDALRGDAIPLLAQITAVADVFDALTTVRPYRAPLSRERAYEELVCESERGWHQRDLIQTFIHLGRNGLLPSPDEAALSPSR